MKGNSNGKVEEETLHPSVAAFDDLLASALKAFVELSTQIGGDVKTIVKKKNFFFFKVFLTIKAILCIQFRLSWSIRHFNSSASFWLRPLDVCSPHKKS